jgi:hypothetical protein
MPRSPIIWVALRGAAAWLLLLMTASPATAQLAEATKLPASADSFVVMAPGPQYAKGGLHRAIAGRHYRDLWTIPIRVPLLNLEQFAGGLTPVSAHTGSQTKSLRFKGADGREYQFRSVDKDPTATLAPELQTTAVAKALRDGVSASFPAAAVVATGLLQSAGVLHVDQSLAVMPDDPRLGEYREQFKGVLGMIEERPDEKSDETGPYGGPRKVLSPARAFELFDASPDDRVDAHAFLKARLVDIVMGDRDRHRDQFRWAAFGKDHPTLWQPISRDHDEAFVHLDGLALDISRLYYQPLVQFEAKYPSHDRLNWHAREVDRRFLTGLSRETWDSTAREIQRALTDGAIDSAVRRMPPEMYAVGGPRLARLLRLRRDGLDKEALSYYAFLAHEVDIHATNADESADVTRVDDHSVDVSIRARADTIPYFSRRFDDRETQEIRLAMWGGDDRVTIRGNPSPHIKLRVIGGQGNDVFVDSTRTGGITFYDDRGTNEVEGSRRGGINARHYPEWVGSDTNRYPPREWATWWRPIPWLAVNSDLGLFIGAGVLRTGYGFRKSPFSSDIRARIGYATGANAIRADLDGEFHMENAMPFWQLHLLASGIEILHYYGQGNNTDTTGGSAFHRVTQQVYAITPSLVLPVGRMVRARIGPLARWSHTGNNDGRFISGLRDTLLGARDFGQVGAQAALEIDTRDRFINALHGVHLMVAGRLMPAVWDVPSTFGSGEAEASTYLSAPIAGSPTLALRAGGKKVWGRYPFHESAFLGGRDNLRGFHSERFAGDASVYGTAELRITVARTRITLPGEWGLFGNVDMGRVYVDGESPGGWHTGAGGGVWLAFLDRSNAASVGITFTDEGTLVRAGAGLGF